MSKKFKDFDNFFCIKIATCRLSMANKTNLSMYFLGPNYIKSSINHIKKHAHI